LPYPFHNIPEFFSRFVDARKTLAPREAQIDGIGDKSMKFDEATQ
jgi:hypothetical protein